MYVDKRPAIPVVAIHDDTNIRNHLLNKRDEQLQIQQLILIFCKFHDLKQEYHSEEKLGKKNLGVLEWFS